MLYNPGDANDIANKNLAETAAKAAGITFKAVGVDSVNDIGQRAATLAGRRFHLCDSVEHADAGLAGDRVRPPTV